MYEIKGDRFRLRADQILVIGNEDVVQQTAGGIWLTEQAMDRQRHRQWKVHAIGPDVTSVKPGDRVILTGAFTGEPMEWNGHVVRFLRERLGHVISVIEEDE